MLWIAEHTIRVALIILLIYIGNIPKSSCGERGCGGEDTFFGEICRCSASIFSFGAAGTGVVGYAIAPMSGFHSLNLSRKNKLSISSPGLVHFDKRKRPSRYRADVLHATAASDIAENFDSLYENVDFDTVAPDDPLWLTVGTPSGSGPFTRGFAKHFQWRRSLNDGESKCSMFSVNFSSSCLS
jgi:hypothetical protein